MKKTKPSTLNFLKDIPLPFPNSAVEFTIRSALNSFHNKYDPAVKKLKIAEVQKRARNKVFKIDESSDFLFRSGSVISNEKCGVLADDIGEYLSGMSYADTGRCLSYNVEDENNSKLYNYENGFDEKNIKNTYDTTKCYNMTENEQDGFGSHKYSEDFNITNTVLTENITSFISKENVNDEKCLDDAKKKALEYKQSSNSDEEQITIKRKHIKKIKKHKSKKQFKYESDDFIYDDFDKKKEEEALEYLKFRYKNESESEEYEFKSEEEEIKEECVKKLKFKKNEFFNFENK